MSYVTDVLKHFAGAKPETLNSLGVILDVAEKEHAKAVADAPDAQLAERARARAAKDGIGYSEAERLVLAEDPALGRAYREWRLK